VGINAVDYGMYVAGFHDANDFVTLQTCSETVAASRAACLFQVEQQAAELRGWVEDQIWLGTDNNEDAKSLVAFTAELARRQRQLEVEIVRLRELAPGLQSLPEPERWNPPGGGGMGSATADEM
jgi:hypothetical protein